MPICTVYADRTLKVKCNPADTDRKEWVFVAAGDDETGAPLYRIYGDTLLTEVVSGRRQWYSFRNDSSFYIGEETRYMKQTPSSVYGELDNLVYSYSGNKVTGISAITEALPFEGMTGLGKSGNHSLGYDDSGRLMRDSSRGITNISYDNDGRVTNVKFSDMSEQQY